MYGVHEIPMSLDEYHRLPRRLGWEYDYECGHAIVSPADIVIDVSRPVAEPVDVGSIPSLRLCSVEADKAFALEKLYVDAFRGTAEAAGIRDEDVCSNGTFSMILYASGAMGQPMNCSRAWVDGNAPVAALLVVEASTGPRIHLLMVHPRLQRRGLATALFAEVCATLTRQNFSEIRGRYLLANEPCKQWYRKMGFIERPDRAAIEHHRRFYHAERSRLEGSASAEMKEVERELERWQQMAAGV